MGRSLSSSTFHQNTSTVIPRNIRLAASSSCWWRYKRSSYWNASHLQLFSGWLEASIICCHWVEIKTVHKILACLKCESLLLEMKALSCQLIRLICRMSDVSLPIPPHADELSIEDVNMFFIATSRWAINNDKSMCIIECLIILHLYTCAYSAAHQVKQRGFLHRDKTRLRKVLEYDIVSFLIIIIWHMHPLTQYQRMSGCPQLWTLGACSSLMCCAACSNHSYIYIYSAYHAYYYESKLYTHVHTHACVRLFIVHAYVFVIVKWLYVPHQYRMFRIIDPWTHRIQIITIIFGITTSQHHFIRNQVANVGCKCYIH